MTEENQHDQDHGRQDGEEQLTGGQIPQQNNEPQTVTGQGEETRQGQTQQGSDAASSDEATNGPPAGTTTPGTLFASDEMEGMKSEEAKNKEEVQQKRKEAASQSGSTEKKYPKDTEFRYSGHTKVLPEEMSEPQIFKWVADDFPEIEKGKFTLRYDSAKSRLVPIPEAQKKGVPQEGAVAESAVAEDADVAVPETTAPSYEVRTEPPAGDRPPVYRLLCADGVYEVRTNQLGTYVARLDSELTLAEGYYPSVPKAPASLLAEIVRIFKERPETEALIDLVYDRREGRFHLVWNQKQASAGSVDYDPLPDDENFVLYAEIHSHNKMRPFFSPTDDAAEIKTAVYGVVGRINDDVPEARFRYSCGGHFRELLAEEIFDDPSVVAATVRRPAR